MTDYVLQRALLVAEGDQREELFDTVRQQLVNTRRVSAVVSKHVVSSKPYTTPFFQVLRLTSFPS